MDIVQVNTADSGGGAEQVALSLFREYRRRGHGSWLVVGDAQTHDEGVVELDDAPLRGAWTRALTRAAAGLLPVQERIPGIWHVRRTLLAAALPGKWLGHRRGLEDFDFPASQDIDRLVPRRPDVIHAHNLHSGTGYFDLRALAPLSQKTPFFVTMHDAWLLSGHCAHSFGCERWVIGCGDCPDLSIYPSVVRDATAENWARKRDIYARSRLYVAAPSQWLMSKAERSMLAPGIVESRVIPNGIDVRLFTPGSAADARERLSLPAEALVVLVAANSLGSGSWKDVGLMRATVEKLPAETVVLAVGEERQDERIGEVIVQFLARRRHEEMPDVYRAADLFVHAARADTFPTVVIEAMACGIPVVASAVGGIPEQIEDGVSGLLARNAEELASGVVALLGDAEHRRSIGAAAAAAASSRFSVDRQVDAYLDWYAEVLAS